MWKIIKRKTSTLALILSRFIKGRHKLIMISKPGSTKILLVRTIYGYEIEIHSQVNRFILRYERSFIPNSEYSVFKVWGTCNESAPDDLKKALSSEVYLPRLFSEEIDTELHNKYMINAYMDIVLDRVATLKATGSTTVSY